MQPPSTSRKIKTHIWRKNQILFRITDSGHENPVFFGRSGNNRWDSIERSFGVMYAGDSMDVAFAETYGHDIMDYKSDEHKVITPTELLENDTVEFMLNRDLRLAKFYGDGLPYLNLDASILTIEDYGFPQAWSSWLHQNHKKVDGVIYHARHLPDKFSIALFERANSTIEPIERRMPVMRWSDQNTGENIIDVLSRQGWAIVPD